MIRVPDPIMPDVGMQVRILYTLSFALASGILSKFEFFGSVAWIFFGYSLQWTWLSFPVFKVERSHGVKSSRSRRDKVPQLVLPTVELLPPPSRQKDWKMQPSIQGMKLC